ncbi:hypothetical protein evm_001413 [Chilo suppressalis]|nr:hypothetical protein evm_001413 [Chilo suppressalis]
MKCLQKANTNSQVKCQHIIRCRVCEVRPCRVRSLVLHEILCLFESESHVVSSWKHLVRRILATRHSHKRRHEKLEAATKVAEARDSGRLRYGTSKPLSFVFIDLTV